MEHICYYIAPITCNTIPTTKSPKIIVIGDMRLRNSHIHKIVNSNGAKPGMSESRLSCNVVTSVSVNERPASYSSKAVLPPSITDGKIHTSIESTCVNVTEAQ